MLMVGAQALFVVAAADGPVRFGVPVPAAAVARGLGLVGEGALQWRRLPVGDADSDPVWIEVALDGVRGSARLVAGGVPPSPDGTGPVVAHDVEERVAPYGRDVIERWAWRSGVVDERLRSEFHAATDVDGETFQAGEAFTRWRRGQGGRAVAVCGLPRRVWTEAGVLPAAGRLGKGLRGHLRRVRRRLVEMPGLRGAGDFVRDETIVTNLEYDTTLGLLRLALATGDVDCLLQGLRAAHHLRDRDLDLRSGLPYVHGADHRGGVVACGHVWVQGMLLAGLLSADDALIEASRSIARALATRPPHGTGRNERARDYAWPLLELECLQAVAPDALLGAAADRLAGAIDRRFDPGRATWRFGEGEVGEGVYLERGWITGGIVIPALRAHLARRPDVAIAEHVRLAQAELLARIGRARAGLPIHWRTAGGAVFAEHRGERDPRALLLLDGVPAADLRRLLQREEVRDCTAEVPASERSDLPTAFTMVARCWWIYR